jgi:hypothetical protein
MEAWVGNLLAFSSPWTEDGVLERDASLWSDLFSPNDTLDAFEGFRNLTIGACNAF